MNFKKIGSFPIMVILFATPLIIAGIMLKEVISVAVLIILLIFSIILNFIQDKNKKSRKER